MLERMLLAQLFAVDPKRELLKIFLDPGCMSARSKNERASLSVRRRNRKFQLDQVRANTSIATTWDETLQV